MVQQNGPRQNCPATGWIMPQWLRSEDSSTTSKVRRAAALIFEEEVELQG